MLDQLAEKQADEAGPNYRKILPTQACLVLHFS
jgi:hypothetical protein